MPTVKNTRPTKKSYPKPSVVTSGRDYSKDPFVLEKVARAKEMMSKVRIPDHLKK